MSSWESQNSATSGSSCVHWKWFIGGKSGVSRHWMKRSPKQQNRGVCIVSTSVSLPSNRQAIVMISA